MTVILVGQPNAGKSVVFNKLTGLDHYGFELFGTSLDIMRAKWILEEIRVELVDTPGIYSLA